MSAHSGSDGDADMAMESPAPRAASAASTGRANDELPDVRALADALDQPPDFVRLEVRGAGAATLAARCCLLEAGLLCGAARSAHACSALPQHAVGSRVSLVTRSGTRLRVALRFAAAAGPLTSAALEAVQAVLPTETWWRLYRRWLATEGAGAACSVGGACGVRTGTLSRSLRPAVCRAVSGNRGWQRRRRRAVGSADQHAAGLGG